MCNPHSSSPLYIRRHNTPYERPRSNDQRKSPAWRMHRCSALSLTRILLAYTTAIIYVGLTCAPDGSEFALVSTRREIEIYARAGSRERERERERRIYCARTETSQFARPRDTCTRTYTYNIYIDTV